MKAEKAISMVTMREMTLLLSPGILKKAINTIRSRTGTIARISVIIVSLSYVCITKLTGVLTVRPVVFYDFISKSTEIFISEV